MHTHIPHHHQTAHTHPNTAKPLTHMHTHTHMPSPLNSTHTYMCWEGKGSLPSCSLSLLFHYEAIGKRSLFCSGPNKSALHGRPAVRQGGWVGGWVGCCGFSNSDIMTVHCLETARRPWGLSAGSQVCAKSPRSPAAGCHCVSWEPWLLDAGGVFVIKRG